MTGFWNRMSRFTCRTVMDRVKLQQISGIYWAKSAEWCCHSENLYEHFSSNATTWGNLKTQWTEGLNSTEIERSARKKETDYHWATCRLLGNKVLTNVWHDLFKIISLHYLKVILLKGSLAIELNTINMAFRFSLRATWRPRRVTSSSSRVHNGWLWLLLCNLLSKIWFPVLP